MPTTDWIVLVVGLILTITSIINNLLLLKDRANKPHQANEERIAKLEQEVDDIKDLLKNDNSRINYLESGNSVLLRSMSALLSHGIDGNNDAEMRKCREDLNRYLFDRGTANG